MIKKWKKQWFNLYVLIGPGWPIFKREEMISNDYLFLILILIGVISVLDVSHVGRHNSYEYPIILLLVGLFLGLFHTLHLYCVGNFVASILQYRKFFGRNSVKICSESFNSRGGQKIIYTQHWCEGHETWHQHQHHIDIW